MAKSKPIRWKLLLSLPLVVAAVGGGGLAFEHWQRQNQVAQLAAVVIRGEPDEATAAIQQLAALPNPPLDILVAAAASPSRPVAHEAQNAITGLLQVSQRQLRFGLDPGKTARQLQRLAEALDKQRQSFAAADFRWLSRTAETIVRQAGAVGVVKSSDVAYHCDVVLAMIETRTRGVSRKPSKPTLTNQAPHVARTSSAAEKQFLSAPSMDPPHSVAPAPDVAPKAISDPESLFVAPPVTAWQSILPSEKPRDDLPAVRHVEPPKDSPVNGEDLKWAPRTLPIPESAPRPIESEKRGPSSTSTDSSPSAPLRIIASRILLERWLSEEGRQRFVIEDELSGRGFAPLQEELVRPLLSDDPQVRVQLVQTIMNHPSVNAPPWLTLLADDRDANVRLAAINVMATSRDPKLLEKAWQVALHDRDPRIADLANRLRDRRAGTQRR